jgi:hypothetical protein
MTCPVCKKKHHSLCHKCPHSADVQAGKYTDRQWNKVPCSGCRLAELAVEEPSHQGQTFVEFSATDFDRPNETKPHYDPSPLADFLREFILLSRREQIVVVCRYLHMIELEKWGYDRIGKRLSVSPQAAFAIHRRVARKISAIGVMFGIEAKEENPEAHGRAVARTVQPLVGASGSEGT